MSDECIDEFPVIPESEKPEEVLSGFAHECRHPINAIKGYAKLIADGIMDSQEAAERIEFLADQMDALRNTVLDYLERREAAHNHEGT